MDSFVVAIVGLVASTLGGLIVYFGNRQMNRANALNINAKTITSLSERIDVLETRDAEKERQIDKLEKEYRRVVRAYEYSLKHIRKLDPQGQIPDFLNWDTEKLAAFYKEHYG